MIAIVEVLYTENRSVVHVAGREEDKIRVVGRKRESLHTEVKPQRGELKGRGLGREKGKVQACTLSFGSIS